MNDDPLSPLLAHFSARARVFYTGNLCGQATFDEAANVAFLHLLSAGRMRLRDRHGLVTTLSQPTLLFYSRPLTHWIEPDPDGGADLACASVSFDHQAFNPIALALPPRFQCALDELDDSRALLDLLFTEAFAQRPARGEVLNRLFELVLIQLLRTTIQRGIGDPGFLRALAHPQLSKALNAVHAHPEHAWSLQALAQSAAMSRSSFAEVFRREVGQTPGEYLTRWRITTAQALLRRGTPLKIVGERVGYASQAGFLRAFKQVVGSSPKQWLRTLGMQT
jgi:AraC-like DNA-binding protein